MTFLTNKLVLQLPKEDQCRLQRICQPVELTAGKTIESLGPMKSTKVYFLESACVALLVKAPPHQSLAVGLIGSEGIIGLGSIWENGADHWRYLVQTSGRAWAADSSNLTALLHQHPALLWVISQYLWQLAEHVATLSSAMQFHDIAARLAHWLTLSADRAQTPCLQLTHEHLAQMLGVRRVSITLAAGELKERGLIHYQRGLIDILNMSGLRQMSH